MIKKGKLENSWALKRFKLNPIKCTDLEGESNIASKMGKLVIICIDLKRKNIKSIIWNKNANTNL